MTSLCTLLNGISNDVILTQNYKNDLKIATTATKHDESTAAAATTTATTVQSASAAATTTESNGHEKYATDDEP